MEEEIVDECTICRNRSIDIQFLPCGHRCSCRRCYARLRFKWKHDELCKICPMCRGYIENFEYLI